MFTSCAARTPTITNTSNAAEYETKAHTFTESGLHLFYVRFGYVEENLEQFKIDLQAIRPMLDKMFDFEKTMMERTQLDSEQFMKSGSYLYLRSGLIERWNVLVEFNTYPNMIKPLKIKFSQQVIT